MDHRQGFSAYYKFSISYYNITIIANVINNDHLRGTIKLVLVTEIYLWDYFWGLDDI